MADIINPAYLSMPAQVQKNKDDIAELKASAWNPNVKGAYSDSVSYNYNDIVSYTDGNVYYHSSETQTQGVPPTNSETWTLYQIGIQGKQGEPGQQGEPGRPGADALFYTTIYNSTSDPTAPGTFNIPVLPFSRTPKQNDAFVLLSSYNNILYAGMAIIINVGNPDATVQYQGVQRITGTNGTNGADGKPALMYGSRYSSVGEPSTGKPMSLNLASFSRTPAINELFLLLSSYNTGGASPQNIMFAGIAQVTNISGTTVTAEYTTLERITGNNGANGADGQGFNYMGAWVSENEYHEYDVVTYNGSSYVNILAISGSATPPASDATHWNIFAERGAQGPSGSPLYRHHTEITFPSQTTGVLRIWLEVISTSNINVNSLQNFITVYGDNVNHIAVGRFMPSGGTALIVCTFNYDSATASYNIVGCRIDTTVPEAEKLEVSSYNLQFNDVVSQIN